MIRIALTTLDYFIANALDDLLQLHLLKGLKEYSSYHPVSAINSVLYGISGPRIQDAQKELKKVLKENIDTLYENGGCLYYSNGDGFEIDHKNIGDVLFKRDEYSTTVDIYLDIDGIGLVCDTDLEVVTNKPITLWI